MKKQKQKLNKDSGLKRIEQIKSQISNCGGCTKLQKVEVYQMWQGVFPDQSTE